MRRLAMVGLTSLLLVGCGHREGELQVAQTDDVYMTCRQLIDSMKEMKQVAEEHSWRKRDLREQAIARREHLRQVYLKKGCNNHDYWLDDQQPRW